MTQSSLSGSAAIVGLGATEFSKNSGRTELRLALEATDSAWVMDSGSIVERGASQALLADDRIAQIYLGEIPA